MNAEKLIDFIQSKPMKLCQLCDTGEYYVCANDLFETIREYFSERGDENESIN